MIDTRLVLVSEKATPMTNSAINHSFKALTQLSSVAYHKASSKPPIYTSATSDIILLFTWAAAHPRNIANYIASYSMYFPSAQIFSFTTSFTDVLHYSPASKRKQLAHAVEEIRQASPTTRISVHLFSNGGAFKMTQFASLYRDITGKVLPIQAMILDSAPGKALYWKTIAAINYGLPKKWHLRWPLSLLAHLLVIYFVLIAKLPGRVDRIKHIRRDTNNPRLVDVRARRCYIYSKTDDLVGWRDVEDHADDAEARGWNVRKEEFKGSRHVAHVTIHEERYWRTVKSVFV